MLRTRVVVAGAVAIASLAGQAAAVDFGPNARELSVRAARNAPLFFPSDLRSAALRTRGTAFTGLAYGPASQAFPNGGAFPPLSPGGPPPSQGLAARLKQAAGPVTLAAEYRYDLPLRLPLGVRPYVGAGAVYMLAVRAGDGLLPQLDQHDHAGVAGQVGALARLSRFAGVFVEAKKALLHTNADDLPGPIPAASQIRLDPVVVSAGASFRF